MIRIVYTLCEALAVIACVEHVRDVAPPAPTDCAEATEAWLETQVPEGSGIGVWRCVDPPPPGMPAETAESPASPGTMR